MGLRSANLLHKETLLHLISGRNLLSDEDLSLVLCMQTIAKGVEMPNSAEAIPTAIVPLPIVPFHCPMRGTCSQICSSLSLAAGAFQANVFDTAGIGVQQA